jgi:hypothetical protein
VSPLVRLVATEQEACYLFGVLGARAEHPALVGALRAAYDEHVAARDALIELLRRRRVAVPAPAVGYAVPPAWHGDPDLRAGAQQVQARCTAAYGAAVGALTGADRRTMAEGAGTSAVREVLLGARSRPLPGLR